MALSESLGVRRSIELQHGTIRYRERGFGPAVVFIHGVLVNGDLWRHVVPPIADAGFRCLTPDWPLGAHELPMRESADLSPPGQAAMIAEFLTALDLSDVTLVANDTGGALVQILITQRPERIKRVVLTSCDSFERFFPPVFQPLALLARLPGAMWLVVQATRLRAVQRLPIVFGWVAKRPIPAVIADSYLRPARTHRGVRRDLRRFLRDVHRRHTLAAAEAFPQFERPVLVVWADEDRLFPVSLARRLAELLPDAELRLVSDSYTFIPEDQPAVLSDLVIDFARSDPAGR